MTVLHGAQALADEAMNAMLKNLKLPDQEKVEVTYTTRCGSTHAPPAALHTFRLSFSSTPAHARGTGGAAL